ncbi:MAG TPA: hypothetical protein VGN16_01830 [Acidobacteriaceae bacterium]
MKRKSKAALLIAGLLMVSFGFLVYALFHGYFDRGQFEVQSVRWSPSNQVAIVAERSDNEALSGYTYFVVIGDHVLSPGELRRAYYSSAVVFAAGDSCVKLHWQGSETLVISCDGPTLMREHIEVEKRQSGSTAVLYENIPLKEP